MIGSWSLACANILGKNAWKPSFSVSAFLTFQRLLLHALVVLPWLHLDCGCKHASKSVPALLFFVSSIHVWGSHWFWPLVQSHLPGLHQTQFCPSNPSPFRLSFDVRHAILSLILWQGDLFVLGQEHSGNKWSNGQQCRVRQIEWILGEGFNKVIWSHMDLS